MRASLAIASWGCIACLGYACSTYSGSDATASDGGVTDGPGDTTSSETSAPPPPPDDGGADAGLGPNVLVNGDFELGCAAWDATNATLTEDTIAHSGARSCRVCVKNLTGITEFQTFAFQNTPPALGGRWIAEVWLHEAGDAGAPTIQLVPQAHDDAGNAIDQSLTAGPALDATWQRVTAVLDITKPAIDVSLLVGASTPNLPQCFLVDDASLRLVTK